jgi:hypothetical protein
MAKGGVTEEYHGDTIANNLGDAADESHEGILNTDQALVVLLKACKLWWSTNARRSALGWAFLVPDDETILSKAQEGMPMPKNHCVTCWVCHLEHYGEMHANFPIQPKSEDAEELQVDEAYDVISADVPVRVDRSKVMEMSYKHTSSSTHLKQHAERNHPYLFHALLVLESKDKPTVELSPNKRDTKDTALAFRSIKRLKGDDPRQRLFNRLLTYVVVFLRWSFSVVDNPWFRCLVWFLDGSIKIPSRKEWQNKHLADVVDECHKQLIEAMDGVKGVALMFDLWMSRAGEYQHLFSALVIMVINFCHCVASGEDVLSLDVAFIDSSWNYNVWNLGLVHCKEGTTGAQVANAIRPSLDQHNLRHRVYAYVKDQGSNLKTTAQALSASFDLTTNVCCKAIGQAKPFAGIAMCPSVLYPPLSVNY